MRASERGWNEPAAPGRGCARVVTAVFLAQSACAGHAVGLSRLRVVLFGDNYEIFPGIKIH
jgi:hypothetical protein